MLSSVFSVLSTWMNLFSTFFLLFFFLFFHWNQNISVRCSLGGSGRMPYRVTSASASDAKECVQVQCNFPWAPLQPTATAQT
ncbi:hypothetical protein DKP78_23290 [Enterococcus faecium]|nr:hypothetical protein DKP78_23290 [Enterococcus faecium]